jgi:hypothetical protein
MSSKQQNLLLKKVLTLKAKSKNTTLSLNRLKSKKNLNWKSKVKSINLPIDREHIIQD